MLMKRIPRILGLVPLALGLVLIYLAYSFTIENIEGSPSSGDSLVSGTVIGRTFAPQRFRPTGPRLFVRIDNSPVVVHADLTNDKIDKLPDRVSFYYSGNPQKEVRLLQERNLIADITIIIIFSMIFFGFSLYVLVWENRECKPNHKKEYIDELW